LALSLVFHGSWGRAEAFMASSVPKPAVFENKHRKILYKSTS
jgi:hypothetical protein